jgi:hypothetical protein
MFTPAQILHNWHEQWPNKQDDPSLKCHRVGLKSLVYRGGLASDFIFYHSMQLLLGLILNDTPCIMSYSSSGSIVSDYGLDDWVRSLTEAQDFSSSPCIQTGSGAHPASYPMDTGVLSPGVKRGRGMTLTTHTHLVPRLRMSRSYTSSPPMYLHGM